MGARDLMSPTRRAVLGAAGAALASPVAAATPAVAPRKLIVVLAYGGWDTTYALDPKPGVPGFATPDGVESSFGALRILTSDARPSVTAFFERTWSTAALLHGVSVDSLSHPQCLRAILTGRADGGPDVAVAAAAELASDRPLPCLVSNPAAFPGPYAAQSAHVGATNQLAALVDPTLAPAPVPEMDVPSWLSDKDDQAIDDWLVGRLDAGAVGRDAEPWTVADFRWSLDAARALEEYRDILATPGEPTSFATAAIQACAALSAGLSWSANLDSRLDFDTHLGNDRQDLYHEVLFSQLLVLLDTLESEPGEATGSMLADETTVVVLSEMTRTPALNVFGGKDHWPFATVLAFGAGVRGGRSYGATDDLGLPVPVDRTTGEIDPSLPPLGPDEALAGVLELVGANPAATFPDSEVFRGWIA